MNKECDFSGWATRANLLCSDGRIIHRDAFKENDGQVVPLVWMHQHNDPFNVLGQAVLENRNDGVYAYCTFNETDAAAHARKLVEHKDVRQLSIYANQLKQQGQNVLHGTIREVSLVLSGANPGASIENIMLAHGDDLNMIEDEAVIYTGEPLALQHSNEGEPTKEKKDEEAEGEKKEKETETVGEKTIQEIIDSMNEEQQELFYTMVGHALENGNSDNEEEDEDMRHNVFDADEQDTTLMHDGMMTIIADAKRQGSMKESFMAHAADYGIDQIDYLLPDVKSLNTPPEFISREMDWVQKVIGATHHTPFSRIKSMFADITEDEARAKGYIKGNLKKEEVFSLLKRSTTPTTIYKKQKMDRDDIIDITDFDVIAWLKKEMRTMLDEEIARAILVGDGRLASSDDKISESHIRPVLNDADLFVIRWSVAAGANDSERAKNFIRCAIKARKNYKGSGQPSLYTTEDMLTDVLLLEDTLGHRLYKTEQEAATALRVKEIITVPVMENLKDKDNKDVYGIIVNLSDYNVGADSGGAINMFDDFDIDYNQQKYLIETRCSGALIKPFSAIVLRSGTTSASEEPGLAAAKAALN